MNEEFKGSLGNYKVIPTEDNSITVYSEFFDENCHNVSGAYQETIYNYIDGTKLIDQVNNEEINIFDVGFGLGIGLTAFIEFVENSPISANTKLSYTSIELDEDFCLWALNHFFKKYKFIKVDNTLKASIEINNYKLDVVIYIGDGRKTILEASNELKLPKFTSIFQDAFSPKKNPALWTVEWFRLLKENSDKDVYMSTYSSSVPVRKAMVEAGWSVLNHPGFGQKKLMTISRLNCASDERALELLQRSKLEALRDDNI